MKKKLILLLFSVFLVTGCTANYNIEIYNKTINENIDLIDNTSISAQDNRDKIENIFIKYHEDTDMLYLREFKEFTNEQKKVYSLSEKSSYSFEEYQQELQYFRNCCRSVELSDDGNYINFRTLGYIKWFEKYEELDKIQIKVKSNHKVKEHNADKVNRYEYTWDIDRYNYQEKIPSLKLYSNKYVFDYEGKFMKRVIYFIVITVIIVSIVGGLYFHINEKNKNANQI